MPHTLLGTLDYWKDKLNIKYTWSFSPFLSARKTFFKSSPQQLLIFSVRTAVSHVHRQYGKEKEMAVISSRWHKLPETHGDSSGCHAARRPVLAFSGWQLEMPNVLKIICLPHTKKCCPKCCKRQRERTKPIIIKEGGTQSIGRHQSLQRDFQLWKAQPLSVSTLWCRVSHSRNC